MTRQQTLQLKGIAILFMLWLHLFSSGEGFVSSLSWINGAPLAVVLKKLCSMCVPMYAFLGGVGLAATYEAASGHNASMHNGRRVAMLYANFWTVLLIFYGVGYMNNPTLFNFHIPEFLYTLAALDYKVNGTWWFLLPYAMITAMAAPFLRQVYSLDRKMESWMFVALLVMHIAGYVGVDIASKDNWLVYILLRTACNFFLILFPFATGALFHKHRTIHNCRLALEKRFTPRRKNMLVGGLLACLVFIKLCIGASALFNPWFVFLLIPLYCMCGYPSKVERLLCFFGRHSTNIWLCHNFFIFGVWGSLIYDLHFPLLIFAALLLVSTVTSYIIKMVYVPVKRLVEPVLNRALQM